DFIARFSVNASKSRQATSRKKILDKITLDDLQPSTRKYPFIEFKPERESGRSILYIEDVEKQVEDCKLTNISFNMMKGDKDALIGDPLKTT
ncbi:ABC transporter ATP-binding protein, partial [Streptococcus gordonii]|nr:ABC transporter ATP-binding protein [Streptococcus gordonii]